MMITCFTRLDAAIISPSKATFYPRHAQECPTAAFRETQMRILLAGATGAVGGIVRLTVTHDCLEPSSEILRSISAGWPKGSLKLEGPFGGGTATPALW